MTNNTIKHTFMTTSKFSVLLILFLLCATMSNGQQEIILTKYTYNSLFFNPAYAGSHGLNEGTAIIHYRNQWLGLDGAPTTILAGGEGSFYDNRLGLGLGLASESIGVESRIDINGNAAYRIQLDEGFLAGGIRVNYSIFNTDFNKVNPKDGGDIFDETSYGFNVFTIGTGLYYNNDGLYVGFSLPSLAVISSNISGIGDRARHMYFHTGILLGDEYSKIRFEPSLLVKYQSSVPLQFTIGINAWLTKDFAIGGHYRSSDALALSAELHFKDHYRLAAAYDFTLSDIRKYSNGTIEFLLGYRFNYSKENSKVKNLRHGGRF